MHGLHEMCRYLYACRKGKVYLVTCIRYIGLFEGEISPWSGSCMCHACRVENALGGGWGMGCIKLA